jgi:hypothetical protein
MAVSKILTKFSRSTNQTMGTPPSLRSLPPPWSQNGEKSRAAPRQDSFDSRQHEKRRGRRRIQLPLATTAGQEEEHNTPSASTPFSLSQGLRPESNPRPFIRSCWEKIRPPPTPPTAGVPRAGDPPRRDSDLDRRSEIHSRQAPKSRREPPQNLHLTYSTCAGTSPPPLHAGIAGGSGLGSGRRSALSFFPCGVEILEYLVR